MNSQGQKVVVITGAAQGIGAELVVSYRKLGHGVVATSRTIAASRDPNVVTVQGDVPDPATAERVIASWAKSSASTAGRAPDVAPVLIRSRSVGISRR